ALRELVEQKALPVELVGARDGAGALEQIERRALRALSRLHHGLVLRRVLVGLEEDLVELIAHGRGTLAGDELAGPGLDLRGDLLLALDRDQRGLDDFLRRLLEQPLARAAEVVRRIEEAKQRRGLLLDTGLDVEVIPRQVGESELAVRREGPG